MNAENLCQKLKRTAEKTIEKSMHQVEKLHTKCKYKNLSVAEIKTVIIIQAYKNKKITEFLSESAIETKTKLNVKIINF